MLRAGGCIAVLLNPSDAVSDNGIGISEDHLKLDKLTASRS